MASAEAIRKELQHTGKYMMQYDLAWGNAGNISARTEGTVTWLRRAGRSLANWRRRT